MSYVRFGWGPNDEFPGTSEAQAAGASSLYLIGTSYAGHACVECVACLLSDGRRQSRLFATWPSLADHLQAHRNAGHVVHQNAADRLQADFKAGRYPGPVCGDFPAPCNCDDPTTHNGHNTLGGMHDNHPGEADRTGHRIAGEPAQDPTAEGHRPG